jgi:hypothetical protein
MGLFSELGWLLFNGGDRLVRGRSGRREGAGLALLVDQHIESNRLRRLPAFGAGHPLQTELGK